MVIDEFSRRLARHMFRVGVGLVELHDAEARGTARAALDHPCADTMRDLLEAGRGRAWLPSVIDALAQVGIAAAEDVLGDDDEMPDDVANAIEKELDKGGDE